MNGNYVIKGSNTLYKVWGIILLVLTILGGIGLLVFGIIVLAASTSDTAQLFWAYGGSAADYTIIIILIAFLIAIVGIWLQVTSALVLIRPYVKSKGVLTALAVYYFVMGAFNLISMFLAIASKTAVGIIIYLLAAGWTIATGVILIMKGTHAVEQTGTGGQEIIPDKLYEKTGVIEGVFGEFLGKSLSLKPGMTCKIGREPECNIQLQHPKVSRIHCTIYFLQNGNYSVTDYSSNGTYYENLRLEKGVATEVQAGSHLVIGDADTVFCLQ